MPSTFLNSGLSLQAEEHFIRGDLQQAITLYESFLKVLHIGFASADVSINQKCIEYEMLFFKLEIAASKSVLGLKTMNRKMIYESLQVLKTVHVELAELKSKCSLDGWRLDELDIFVGNMVKPISMKFAEVFAMVMKNKLEFLQKLSTSKASKKVLMQKRPAKLTPITSHHGVCVPSVSDGKCALFTSRLVGGKENFTSQGEIQCHSCFHV